MLFYFSYVINYVYLANFTFWWDCCFNNTITLARARFYKIRIHILSQLLISYKILHVFVYVRERDRYIERDRERDIYIDRWIDR